MSTLEFSSKPAAAIPDPRTILLVEDESMVREITCTVLESAGYSVLASAGGEEAIRLAQIHAGRIGLLLTDVVMPGMNGPELARRLRSEQSELATLFMSGYTGRDVIPADLHGRKTHYIQKPFTMESLLQRVHEALQGGTTAGSGPMESV